jgi:hypothetical protein
MALPVRNIRLRGFSASTLDNASGSSGEIFWDQTNNTLRIFSGQGVGGAQLAKSNLANVPDAVFLAKATAAGIGASSGEVEQGTQGSLAYYASTGTTVEEQPNLYWNNNKLSITGSLTVSAAKNLIRFHWDSLADLQNEVSPTLYHGMLAHTHLEGRVYFAHSGAWTPLALQSDVPSTSINSFSNIAVSGQSTVVAASSSDTLNLEAGTGITITTNSTTDTITITGQSTQNTFGTIAVAGQTSLAADQVNDTLTLAAGTGITLTTNAGTDTVTITASTPVTSIDQLSDVDTTTTSPLVGQVLKWFGTSWRPATDATVGGAGTDADTLDGQDSAFYLDFGNLNNKPNIFQAIAVSGQNDIEPTQYGDTLTIAAGPNVTITTDDITKTLTIDSQAALSYSIDVQNTVAGSDIKLIDNNNVESTVSLVSGSGITMVGNSTNNTITITSTSLTNSFSNILVAGNPTVYATNSTESLTFEAGTNVQIATNNETKTIVISASGGGGGATNSFGTIQVSGQSNVQADDVNDTLTLVGGTGVSITTNSVTDTITFSASLNTFSTMNVAGTSIPADTSTSTFTMFQGSGITLSADAGNKAVTVTNNGVTQITQGTGITINPSSGVGNVTINNSITNVSNLTDAATAVYPAYTGGGVNTGNYGAVTVDKIFLQAIARIGVGFVYDGTNGGSGFRMDSHYGNTLDPTIYAFTGTTIAFNLNCAGHPFQIMNPGGTVATTGIIHVTTSGTVTTAGTANVGRTSGTLYWQIPETATGNYSYRCTSHPTQMTGTITLKRISLL